MFHQNYIKKVHHNLSYAFCQHEIMSGEYEASFLT